MANPAPITPIAPRRLQPARVAAMGTSLLCCLVLRAAAVRQRLVERLDDVSPRDRALLLLFAGASRLCLRELQRRALVEQRARGLGAEPLDPEQVVEIEGATVAGPTELAA